MEKLQLEVVLKISTPLSTHMNYYIIIARKTTEITNICNTEPRKLEAKNTEKLKGVSKSSRDRIRNKKTP